MSQPFTHLTASVVRAIHTEVLAAHGGASGVRDAALLESAVAAPQATMSGKPLISDPIEAAAAYLFYLCRNHPFIDGNMRTALASCLVFLDANHLLPTEKLPADDWEKLVLDLAESELDRDQTIKRLRRLLKQSSRKKN